MELCLYVNTKLTRDIAMRSKVTRPTYPTLTPGDSLEKKDILYLSFKSIRNLNIKKIILNVEIENQGNSTPADVTHFVRYLSPDAEIISEERRPTNLADWKKSAALAKKFFGEKNPIICMFNHDHIFMDTFHEIFSAQILSLFSKYENLFF